LVDEVVKSRKEIVSLTEKKEDVKP